MEDGKMSFLRNIFLKDENMQYPMPVARDGALQHAGGDCLTPMHITKLETT